MNNDCYKAWRYARWLAHYYDLRVFPCLANKAPACPHGYKNASYEIEDIDEIWGPCEGPLIGVPTGKANNIDVLDIDPRHGGDVWLAENLDKLPKTRVHLTRSGGRHYFFNHREGLRSSAGKIAKGVDVRAEGGYVIWWPGADIKPIVDQIEEEDLSDLMLTDAKNTGTVSHTGTEYMRDVLLPDWPDFLLEKLIPAKKCISEGLHEHNLPDVCDVYARKALHCAAVAVANASEGQRNDTLNREAYSLMRFVPSDTLSPQEITNALAAAALAAGLQEREIAATLASAMRAAVDF